jgi:DsbC/DsbD-like thiol-disulfide interchange protein
VIAISRYKLVIPFIVSVGTASAMHAQGPAPQPVQWKVASVKADTTKGHDAFVIEVNGTLSAGWHVYAQHEPEGGPTPLRVTLDDANLAEIAGKIGGTAPTVRRDKSFQLDTEVYLSDFILSVPMQKKSGHGSATPISIAVRYQACNDSICLPPRTVHLSTQIQ